MFIGFVLAYIPYYNWVRLAFFVFLMAPQTNGAEKLYESVFSPLLKKHEKEIRDVINQVSDKASNVGADLAAQAKDKAKDLASAENMAKAAAASASLQKSLDEPEEKAEVLD